MKTLTIMMLLGFTTAGSIAHAEQSDFISKRCETEPCYACCMATCNKEEKEAYAMEVIPTSTSPSADEATKANQ